jgi:hypothetical protein
VRLLVLLWVLGYEWGGRHQDDDAFCCKTGVLALRALELITCEIVPVR